MYVHCSVCTWSQDDFWDEGYNPIKSLQDNQETLLDFDKLDEPFSTDPGVIAEIGDMTKRQYIAWDLQRKATNILEMAFLTPEAARAGSCPLCGGSLVED